MTILCDIGFKYGTDKCPQIKHHHTEIYFDLFKDRRDEVRKVFEIGVGCEPPMFFKGASLYMWRDFFPNAHIYGIDVRPGLEFIDTRIHAYTCDQHDRDSLFSLIHHIGGDIDLFIDDGAHNADSQIATCLMVMPLLQNGATYVIEDTGLRPGDERLIGYDCEFRRGGSKYRDDCLMIVKHRT